MYTQPLLDAIAEAERLVREAPHIETEADLLGDIGYALHVSGRSSEAEPYFEDALQRYRALNRLDGLHARVMLSNWGVMELATGDVQRALQRYDELLAGHRRLMAWRAPPSR